MAVLESIVSRLAYLATVWLVGCVNLKMFPSVRTISKTSIAPFVFAREWPLPCQTKNSRSKYVQELKKDPCFQWFIQILQEPDLRPVF